MSAGRLRRPVGRLWWRGWLAVTALSLLGQVLGGRVFLPPGSLAVPLLLILLLPVTPFRGLPSSVSACLLPVLVVPRLAEAVQALRVVLLWIAPLRRAVTWFLPPLLVLSGTLAFSPGLLSGPLAVRHGTPLAFLCEHAANV